MKTQEAVNHDHGATSARGNNPNESKGEPIAVAAAEAARLIGIGTRTLWTLTNRGVIPHVRLGRRVVYPVTALEEWLAAQAKGGGSK